MQICSLCRYVCTCLLAVSRKLPCAHKLCFGPSIHFELQDGDWVCKHCRRLLVTADCVITTQHNIHNYTVNAVSGTSAQNKTAAQADGLLVKPQRWMGQSLSAADGNADSRLHCPK